MNRRQSNFAGNSRVKEIDQLAEAFSRAAEAMEEWQRQLDEATLQFVDTMAQALDARDPHTAGHSERVSVNATATAVAMGLSRRQIEIVRIGAKLHDIGKMGIPDAVLRKPGRLTAEEYGLIQLHTQIGKRILEKVAVFRGYLPIVELHHEDYDGGGYPHGLKGYAIPIEVRIVHVADVYDAITNDRAYRPAMPDDVVKQMLASGSGTLFDPAVVEAFFALLEHRKTSKTLFQDVPVRVCGALETDDALILP